MGIAIKQDWIVDKIKAVIKQHFQESRYMDKDRVKEWRIHYIGGVLQVALFLLPPEKYYECKMYCFEEFGYDPGGCDDKQLNFNEWVQWLNGKEEEKTCTS